ncbi:hypothetical protein NE857_01555 [Nocardiopsis exhalans]|uniref:Uncharacterized protein n=1 Tax=Nocardiopsis exhalans TaxID=163604 RepID=A0ABY5D9F9_9ACTN|nr:hypothetical protein [Nocardiopsis exhalans]USY20376.1 hypothetical protein NE857_01555 [Nocardiopsis exhalans]
MHRTVANPTLPNLTLPNPVRWATILWAVAIAAGITETSLAVAPGLADGGAVPWLALVTRALLYTFSALLVAWFARGHGWSRVTLVVLMTGVGLVSVLVSMGIGVLSGLGVFVGLGYEGHGVALLVRIAHTLVYVVAVVVATVAAFTPTANRYFRCSREDRVAAAGARSAVVAAPRGVSA